MVNRRRFLRSIGSVAGAVAAVRAGSVLANTTATRSVSFVHTHTGEELTAAYWKSGSYQQDALLKVNHLLRDFRTDEVHDIDPALLDALFDLQSKTDSDRPFQVISGYRSPKTNEMLRHSSDGVAQHSMHLVGRAIDIRLEGFPTRRLGELARSMGRGGVGYYRASDFVHVDTGRIRFW
jgi:uncharacterized protein YcbK (DUF882 family)